MTEVKSRLPGIDQIIIHLVALIILLTGRRGLTGRKDVMERQAMFGPVRNDTILLLVVTRMTFVAAILLNPFPTWPWPRRCADVNMLEKRDKHAGSKW